MAYLDGFSVRPYGEANSVDGTFAKGVSYMEMPQIFENVGCNGNKRFMME